MIVSPPYPVVVDSESYNDYYSEGTFFDYTKINEMYGSEDNYAPRKQLSESHLTNLENK